MLFVFGYRATKIRSKKISVLIHSSSKYPNLNSCRVAVHFCQIVDGVCIFIDFSCPLAGSFSKLAWALSFCMWLNLPMAILANTVPARNPRASRSCHILWGATSDYRGFEPVNLPLWEPTLQALDVGQKDSIIIINLPPPDTNSICDCISSSIRHTA